MAVMQMQRLSICAMNKNRKAILEELQQLGVMEINTDIPAAQENLMKKDTMESRLVFEKQAQLAERSLEVLQEFCPEKTSMLSALAGKALVDRESYEKAAEDKDHILAVANHLVELKKQYAEGKGNIAKLETQIEALTPWLDLDVPMDTKGTKTAVVFIGAIPEVMTLDQIYEALGAKLSEDLAMDVHIVSAGKDQTCIAALCLRKDGPALEEALRSMGFAKPAQSVGAVPAKRKAELEAEIQVIHEKLDQILSQIQEYQVDREDLKVISDYFRNRSQKYEVLGELFLSEKTFVLSGYIPEEKAESLKNHMEATYDLAVDIEALREDEEMPVKLKNGKLGSCAEGVLSAFGLPAKGEVDPSTVMAGFYIILFGLMLSDAAYGLIVFGVCALLLKKFPRMGESMSKSIRLFMYCGLSTLFWGILFGGYFGDAINVISRTFFGHEIGIPPVWFAPLENPMKLLVYSMLFGVIHLFTGLGMKGYMCLKKKRYLDFFCDVILWYMLLTGLIIMLLPTDIFASVAQTTIVFPPVVDTLGKVLAIAGAVGILLMSGRSSKNPALRIALGAYDLYNITGWLSDVLSYSRLLALGLATGVIASVFNQMGSRVGNNIFGIIVFVIVFIIGHVFNIAINLLGAYVHTCRLQYVEFFGKFFEGGGRAFEPFKANTKYVDIKEETKI